MGAREAQFVHDNISHSLGLKINPSPPVRKMDPQASTCLGHLSAVLPIGASTVAIVVVPSSNYNQLEYGL